MVQSPRRKLSFIIIILDSFGIPLDTRYVVLLMMSNDAGWLGLEAYVHKIRYVSNLLCIAFSSPFLKYSDWEIWTAGLVTDTTVRNLLISSVKKYVSDGQSNVPLSDWYDSVSGNVDGFQARPVVGGHLALVRVLLSSKYAYLPPLYFLACSADSQTTEHHNEQCSRFCFSFCFSGILFSIAIGNLHI